MVRVSDAVRWVEGAAPLHLMEPGDNCGLLAGRMEVEIKGIMVALDATLDVIEEAAAKDCDLLVTHHPLFWRGIRSVSYDTFEGRLAAALLRNDIALYAAHTNLDRVTGGLNDALAARLGLADVVGEGQLYRVGSWSGGDCAALARKAAAVLGTKDVRLYGPAAAPAQRVGCASGGGFSNLREVAALGAQVFLTGDVRHHDALDALAMGLCVIDAGHRATELLGVELLERCLQQGLDGVHSPMRVLRSEVEPYQLVHGV